MKAKTRFHKLTAWLLTLAMLMAFIPSYTLGVSANTGAFEGERVTIGGGSTTYTVTLNTSTNGTVSADKENAAVGETVNLTIEPATGYELDTLTVEDADNGDVTVTDNKFTMPAKNVTVTATFKVEVNYPDGTIIISLDTNGVPTSISGTGWTYDSGTNTLTLTNGYSYAVDGECEAIVNNSGTIVGGTYNNTVNNVGDGDTTWKEKFGVIDGGIFNGDVYNADGFDICTINGGAFNGTVTNKNRGVVNDGIFGGEFLKLTGSTVSGGTFVVEFVVNGGIWATGYTVPTTYTYANGLVLPTSENISNGTLSFDGWYDNETFNGLPLTEISAGSYGKLTFYARFIDGIATWETAGNQAVENTDYTIDADGNYTVLTAKGLAKIANIVNGGNNLLGKTVTLANNIDLLDGDVYQYGATTVTERNSWIPIDGFAGTFDGNEKKIENLYVLTTNKDAGLFGSNVGTIKDIEVASGKVTINVSSDSELHAGGIAASTSGLIDNCVNRAEIYANDTSGSGSVYIGGITGLVSTSTGGAEVSTVSDCTNYGTVSSLGNSSCGISGGGIAGFHFSGRITGRKTLITRCVNEGTISIEPGTGGWAGGIAGTVKSNSNSNTSITATVTNCANKGSVGSNMAGGITGYNTNAAYVYNCYNTGSITGNTNAGGIVGLNYYSNATVANCYSTGSVSTATNIGGIVGRIPSGSISNCYYLSSAATDPYGYKANAATFNDCVAFTSAEGTHTLTSVVNETTDLLTALKAWVSEKNVADYMDWKADAQNSNYPILTEYVVKSYYTITLGQSELILAKGEASLITADVSPEATVTWSSGDDSVATVDANGSVTGVGVGSTSITATVGTESKSCTVYVFGVTMNPQSLELTVGGDAKDLAITVDVPNGIVMSQPIAFFDNSHGAISIAKDDYEFDPTTNTYTYSISPMQEYSQFNLRVSVYIKTSNGSGMTGQAVIDYPVVVKAASAPVKYTVTFDANGGTVTPASATTGTDGKLTELPTPTRTGYIFNGWFDAQTGGTQITTSTVFSANTTAYAQWTEQSRPSSGGGVTRYTVKFDTNGGSEIDSVRVIRNRTIAEPTAPVKDNYTFDGWYTDKELTKAYDFSAKVTKSFTLYAKWAENKTEEPDDNKSGTSDAECDGTIADDCPSLDFTDLDVKAWYHLNIDYVLENGLMNGTSATHFSPDVHLTRAMLVTVLYRAEGEPEIANDESFADVEGGSYYEKAVAWAKANGIVNGTSATTFEPNTNITREQIAAIMHRYADFKEHDVQVGENTNILSYTDAHHISEYAVSSMQYAVGSGLIKGKTETTLNPLDNATRAEAAAILERFSKIIQ